MGRLMSGVEPGDARREPASTALVWIDAREATIVRVSGDGATVRRLESEVPAHHRSTGHVRHEPSVRHGGGRDQSAGE
ncbi:MAG TPA: hypothetical protein VK867_05360, partial [Candidatus Limnocylindrales bacterium]|nr:hypothetical protein [Candidatus Limnocylindrales bacterium]